MKLFSGAMTFLVVSCLSGGLFAKTWYVGGSGADFNDIQPAIDAASPGDIILVRPGTYNAFTLAKGVVVRASDQQIQLVGTEVINVTGIGSGERGAISGFKCKQMFVTSVSGELVLESLDVKDAYNIWSNPRPDIAVDIANAHNVSMTGVTVLGGGGDPVQPAMRIQYSNVRMTQCHVTGQFNGIGPYCCMSDGIGVTGSKVIVSRSDILGGDATPYSDMNGGDGMVADSSTVTVLGSETNFIRGGDGSPSQWDGWCGCWVGGGLGGNGLVIMNGSAVVSRVLIEKGEGGNGNGSDYYGNVVRDDRFAYFDVSDGINPGDQFSLTANDTVSGTFVLLIAQHGGFLNDPGYIGPPFAVIPGGFFFAIPLGVAPAGQDFTRTLQMPSDPAGRGFVIEAQGIILGVDGKNYLTNGVTRVVGE
jgi:hypothetical protein